MGVQTRYRLYRLYRTEHDRSRFGWLLKVNSKNLLIKYSIVPYVPTEFASGSVGVAMHTVPNNTVTKRPKEMDFILP